MVIMLGLCFAMLYSNNELLTASEVTNKFSTVHEATFNITTNSFKYTNLYEETPTTNNVLFNIIHGVSYGLIVEINTLVPVMAYGIKDLPFLIKFIVIALILIFIGSVFRVIYGIIAIVFFVKEKRKSEERFYQWIFLNQKVKTL